MPTQSAPPPATTTAPATTSAGATPPTRFRGYHLLAILPALGMLGGLRFANRVAPYVLGLPFLLFWIVACVLATSGVMWVILALDRRAWLKSAVDGAR